jgi:ATP-dependent DNA helicase RecG
MIRREDTVYEKKSLRVVTKKSPDWDELAKDCVAIAFSRGGMLVIGVEDGKDEPPGEQQVEQALADKVTQALLMRTHNVSLTASVETADNGGQYIQVNINRSTSLPTTRKGQVFERIDDQRRRLEGDELLRAMNDRSTFPWETRASGISTTEADREKIEAFCNAIRASDRVKPSVKEKDEEELLRHYILIDGEQLTNLGALCIGNNLARARIGTAPVIHAIKYNEDGRKVRKEVWDDYALAPFEMVSAVWEAIPDFRESYELPAGLLRESIPAYDEEVVRELLVNALVHKPYTQAGEIFLNLHPDRLEIVNPGQLPAGVTAENILHASVRRNINLARVFHDMKLMEKEGSGFDRIYEVLLSRGRAAPELREGPDRVVVSIQRKIVDAQIIDFMEKAEARFQLFQRERICLGLLAQHETLSAIELAEKLELGEEDRLRSWLGRLLEFGVVEAAGQTKARKYFIAPAVLRDFRVPTSTSLDRIEPHRLKALIVEDLKRFPGSRMEELRQRIGQEIHYKKVKRAMDELIAAGAVKHDGEGRRWRRYWAPS